MRLHPVLIDARPPFLSGEEALSLLQMPVGPASVLELLRAEMATSTRNRVVVVTPFEPSPAYRAALVTAGLRDEDVLEASQFAARLHDYEPSDWLLLRDSRYVSPERLRLAELLHDISFSQQASRHLVALASTSAGTSERVLLDSRGQVSRIQRYYQNVTWPFASGVVLSAVPVAGTLALPDAPVSSLNALRSCLAAAGVPARDFFVETPVFDLSREAGLLGFADHLLLAAEGARRGPSISPTAVVASTARLRGPVRAEDGVVVGERAVVIGPAVLGRASRVGSDAVVAHCLVVPGATVPPGTVARHQVVSTNFEPRKPAPPVFASPAEGTRIGQEAAPDADRSALPLKRALDLVLAALGLLLLSPLLLLLAALVKLESRGPILFGDRREGRGGRRFRCWKFRSMQEGANTRQDELLAGNQVDGPQFKMGDDPRVTRVGHWLRRLDLDEIPQLLNVVAGEMSLVGPRPSPFRENQICVPWREARLSVRPGITGLWQVCRHDRADGDFHQWIYYDMLYVQNASLWLDLKILMATLLTLGGRHPVGLPWLLAPAKFRERRRAVGRASGAEAGRLVAPPAGNTREVAGDRPRLGHLPVDLVTRGAALDRIADLVRGGQGGTVFTPNVDHVLLADKDERFRAAYDDASLSVVDGMPVLWALRLAGHPVPEKISGSDLVRPLAARAADEGWRIFLVGGEPGVGERVAELLRAERSALKVAGVESPLVDMEGPVEARHSLRQRIREAQPHLVLVALGSPKGELWAHEARDELRPAVIVAVGSALDFLAGRARRAPAWMSSAGLEWLYRLAHEPGRLWRRYLVRGPRFLHYLVQAGLSRHAGGR